MKNIIRIAFVKTIPVMFGYLFLGIAFGLLLNKAGYNYIWALFISVFVYAGSMQFVLISLLGSNIGYLSVAFMTLSINSRHLFYGLSFIRKFKRMGKLYYYMIFSLTDETYSLLCSIEQEDSKESDRLFFAISILDQCYWILGSVLGSLIGNLITFNTTGIDFAMTALFVVIFVEQWIEPEASRFARLPRLSRCSSNAVQALHFHRYSRKSKTHIPAVIGGICAVISLIIFGADKFILPALLASVFFLILLKNRIIANESEDK